MTADWRSRLRCRLLECISTSWHKAFIPGTRASHRCDVLITTTRTDRTVGERCLCFNAGIMDMRLAVSTMFDSSYANSDTPKCSDAAEKIDFNRQYNLMSCMKRPDLTSRASLCWQCDFGLIRRRLLGRRKSFTKRPYFRSRVLRPNDPAGNDTIPLILPFSNQGDSSDGDERGIIAFSRDFYHPHYRHLRHEAFARGRRGSQGRW